MNSMNREHKNPIFDIVNVSFMHPQELTKLDSKLQQTEEISLWELGNYGAVDYWLEEYSPEAGASELDRVKGFIEAFHHLKVVEDWGSAWWVISQPLNTPNGENLYEQLGIWGYYSSVVELLECLIGRISFEVDAICNLALGNSYQLRGQTLKAMIHFEECLRLATEFSLSLLHARVLILIGNMYRIQGDFRLAEEYLKRGLVISRNHGIKLQEAVCLHFLGLLFNNMEDLASSQDFYLASLAIAQEIGNLQWQANNWGNLTKLLTKLAKYDEAFHASGEVMLLAQRTHDRYVEAWAWHNRGLLYQKLSKSLQAIDCFEKSRDIFESLGNPEGVESNLKVLALCNTIYSV